MEQLSLIFSIDGKEWKEVDRFFMVSGEILGHLKPMYKKFLPIIRKDIGNQFASQGSPKWKPLSAKYLASSKKMNSKYPDRILKLNGKMWKAATKKGAYGHIERVLDSGIVYGIKLKQIPYARLHDRGGTIKGRGRGIMPKREFLKLTKTGVRRLVQVAHRFIRSKMGAGKTKFK